MFFIAFVLRVDPTLICLYISSLYSMQNFVFTKLIWTFDWLFGIWLNKAVKLLSILINSLWSHRCSAFTKVLPVIKIRVGASPKPVPGFPTLDVLVFIVCHTWWKVMRKYKWNDLQSAQTKHISVHLWHRLDKGLLSFC